MSERFEDYELYCELREREKADKKKVSKEKTKKIKIPLYQKVRQKKEQWPVPVFAVCFFFAFSFHLLKCTVKAVLITVFICGAVLAVAAGWKLFPLVTDWKAWADQTVADSTEDDFQINESSTVYDSDGAVIAILRESADQEYAPYERIPAFAVNAFVAVEDRTFWENRGIDTRGILRVTVDYVTSKGKEIHGASTITQQLVRNVYLSHEVSFERKVKEILLALALTEKYTKEQIMEFYINNICYANGIYGIGGAAKAYFNKSIEELTLSECAYLCAIPNSPTYYDPYVYPERALKRRDKILEDMLEYGYITQEEYDAAIQEEIAIRKPSYEYYDYETTYAADCAVRYLMEQDGFPFEFEWDSMDDYAAYQDSYNEAYASSKHRLYTGGYSIYTSLDSGLCASLQEVLDEQLSFDTETDEETGIYALQGAVTAVDNRTRKVTAIVGGRSQEETGILYSLNRAYQSFRQPGSAFKPLAVYTPALTEGYTASSTVEDIDVSRAKEEGVDVQSLRGTKMTLRNAVEKSRNGVAWKIFDALTPKYGLSFVTAMHFSKIVPDDYYDAAALGGLTYGVTTVEMAAAYSTLANHGDHVDATCIVSIIDTDGNEIYTEPQPQEVYTDRAADDMEDILKGVLISGTASKLGWSRASDIEAFAKTGTTNDSKDGWFCGATPYYSIAVWVGYDTPRTLSNLYGATYPGSIWKESMLSATEGMEKAVFERNSEDESYAYRTGYYSYLEGRNDNEVLSPGYTVGDYRTDRVIGEKVTATIRQMEKMSGMSSELSSLYSEGCQIIDTICSVKYTAEMQAALDAAFEEAKNRATGETNE